MPGPRLHPLVTSVAIVALLGAVTAAGSSPPELAPGPWRLARQATATGRDPALHLFVRWTPVTEFGARTGVLATPPIPRRLAIVAAQPAGQRARVTWFAQCYRNREYGYPRSGARTAIGTRAFYPALYAKRVECDLYVNAKAKGRGTLTVRIYGY